MTRVEFAEMLRTDLLDAMRQRDIVRRTALRQALSALDNATAVPSDERAGAVEHAVGLGAAEAARRQLSEQEQRDIVRAEADQLLASAEALPESAAERARAEAAVLRGLLDR